MFLFNFFGTIIGNKQNSEISYGIESLVWCTKVYGIIHVHIHSKYVCLCLYMHITLSGIISWNYPFLIWIWPAQIIQFILSIYKPVFSVTELQCEDKHRADLHWTLIRQNNSTWEWQNQNTLKYKYIFFYYIDNYPYILKFL